MKGASHLLLEVEIAEAEGIEITLLTVAEAVALQPPPSVTVTVYEPELRLLISSVIAPLLQMYEVAAVVKLTAPLNGAMHLVLETANAEAEGALTVI